ncbi:MAG: 2,5-diamino-6-(ribosylamino)-4(3H)-pyrimidinone 5'-phosphate reductase [Candidatus Bathyarchaeota archaeon]
MKKPHVILNAAMTLDGKITTKARDSKISCPEDLKRVHRIRAEVDGVMVGINTLLIDDPKLTTKLPGGKNPIRIIVDSRARTPSSAQALTIDKNTETVIAMTEKAPKNRVKNLLKAGAKIAYAGKGRHVNLKTLMEKLWTMKIRTLLLEGGGTLNWNMLNEGLVDEVYVAVAPMVVGGVKAVTLAEGEGVKCISEALKLEFTKMERFGEDIVLGYRVLHER